MKILSASTLLDEGYVLEANRRFFHPLGLALAVDVDENKVMVIDSRDDPEGFYFLAVDQADADQSMEKMDRIAALEDERRVARLKKLGFWVQPEDSVCEIAPT